MFLTADLWSQLSLKRDDFIGNTRKNWWRWYDDGLDTPFPAVLDGFVRFSLVNPDAAYLPFSDAALWDGYPGVGGPYGNCDIFLRVKSMNSHRFGSRGWGLWYTEDPPDRQRQIWFMQVLDSSGTGYTGLDWWRAETTNGRTEATHHYVELDQAPYNIDNEEWHIYRIFRQSDFVLMQIDGDTVLYIEDDLPTGQLSFHIWVDNLVYEHVDPDIINTYRRSWMGNNDIILDYVQILSSGDLSSGENAAGNMLLREIPNAIYTEYATGLWHNYSFISPGAICIAVITARVERYLDENMNEQSGDDDVRLIFNGTDYGWNTAQSFNGDAEGTVSRTKVISQFITAGSADIEVYGETSPLLYDVTVLGSASGGIVFNQEYNETYSGGDSLWKEINFQTWGGEVAVYVSASADEDPAPAPANHYGYRYSEYSNDEDDDIRIQLNGHSFGYQNDTSFWGNRQFGEPKSVLILENLSQGSHTLRLYSHGSPTLHRVLIYGENDDVSLPVSLLSFSALQVTDGIKLNWKTASEVNNLGFNIFRSAVKNNESNVMLVKINDQLIPGGGNRSSEKSYSFIDNESLAPGNYCYALEDVDFSGQLQMHDTISIFVSERFKSKLPTDFQLQVYPNPFNSSVKIKMNLKKSANVKITLRGINGRIINILHNGWVDSGNFELPWDSVNNRGQSVSSGVYFLQIDIDDNIHLQHKLLLIR